MPRPRKSGPPAYATASSRWRWCATSSPTRAPTSSDPGLTYAIERLEAGEANCLVVTSLERFTGRPPIWDPHRSPRREHDQAGGARYPARYRKSRTVAWPRRHWPTSGPWNARASTPAPVRAWRRRARRAGLRDGPAVADRPALKERIAEMRARRHDAAGHRRHAQLRRRADPARRRGMAAVQRSGGRGLQAPQARRPSARAPGGPTRNAAAGLAARTLRFSATGRQRPASGRSFACQSGFLWAFRGHNCR